MPSSALVVLNRPSRQCQPHLAGAAPFAFHDPLSPLLSALDLGATRGDGIFETISVGNGFARALDLHLRRFAGSAARLELATPDDAVWRPAILAAIAAIDPVAEALVKTVLTRGIENDGRPTGWVYATAAPDYSQVRTDGLRVITLDRGYRHDVDLTSPWLLTGAKTLSHAINRAVIREAERRNADDVIFVSSDGWVLEGPTSSVLFRFGNRILTPVTSHGILDGTTQASIFDFARLQGFETGFEQLTAELVRTADAAWLVSSVRLAAPVRELDGIPFAIDHVLTARMNTHLASVRG